MFLLICCLELVCSYIGNHEEGPATMHRSNRLACILYLPAWRHFWDVFLFVFFLSFFPQRCFWRVFFPWAWWPHVLNKFVLCWLIPVFDCVFLCIIWISFTCFALYSISACSILHVALGNVQKLSKTNRHWTGF